jgi:hypothetical protein
MSISIIIVIIFGLAYNSVRAAAPDLSQYPYLGGLEFDCSLDKDVC